LAPALGQIALAKLAPAHIDAMYDDLSRPTKGTFQLSAATITRIHATLMSALNAGVRAGDLTNNPAALVELPRVTLPERAVWSAEQLVRFLDFTADDELHPLFALLGTRGLRRGEALGLRWSDVDLAALEVRVVQQLTAYGGVPSFSPPKSRSGARRIILDERLARCLRGHRGKQLLLAEQQGWVVDDHSLVFTKGDGSPLNPLAVTRRFDTVVASANLPRIRLHDLRHTSASVGLASGESLIEVSRRLGHSSITITADTYGHVPSEAARAAADRMATYLYSRR